MKLSVQVIVHPDDDTDTPPTARDVFTLDRDDLSPDTLGLQLAEAKDLLVAVQHTLVDRQVRHAVAAQAPCPHCGKSRRHKDTRTIVVRSLFGTLRLPSPRWWQCGGRDQPTRTFQPLAAVLPERTTPELAYLQARFAGLVSYGLSATLLGELLPLGRKLHPAVVLRQTQAVAQRLEDELGDEQPSFIDTCQRDREQLPRPDLPIVVGLDGGYVAWPRWAPRPAPPTRPPAHGSRPRTAPPPRRNAPTPRTPRSPHYETNSSSSGSRPARRPGGRGRRPAPTPTSGSPRSRPPSTPARPPSPHSLDAHERPRASRTRARGGG
ncbi:MAG TPA: hypothetical protein VIW24_00265 [Aldersonia sp.]